MRVKHGAIACMCLAADQLLAVAVQCTACAPLVTCMGVCVRACVDWVGVCYDVQLYRTIY